MSETACVLVSVALFVVGVAGCIAALPSDPDWCAQKGGHYGACRGGKSSVCCYANQ